MIYFVSPTGYDDNPGSINAPWQTLQNAVNRLSPGDILYLRGGDYVLDSIIDVKVSGTKNQPIVIAAYADEVPVIDGAAINFYTQQDQYPFGRNTGVVFFHKVAFIHFVGISLKNSTGHGIAVRDANNIIIDRCKTHNTFACGISLWDTFSTGTICHSNKIIGNTVTKATTWDMLPEGMPRGPEPPHEAISIAGACDFEVAYNTVYNCDKEGIDVKEVSHHGTVHHNTVYDCDRQGLYADAWFGPLTHVDFYHNTVYNCKGAGIVIAVEEGHMVSDIKIYNNNVYDNWGSGILFGIFGQDNIRYRIDVFNNTIKNNGYGSPAHRASGDYFWITGGISLLSANMMYANIYNNILEDNKGFDIGYSSRYTADHAQIADVFAAKRIKIFDNLVLTNNPPPPHVIDTKYDDAQATLRSIK